MLQKMGDTKFVVIVAVAVSKTPQIFLQLSTSWLTTFFLAHTVDQQQLSTLLCVEENLLSFLRDFQLGTFQFQCFDWPMLSEVAMVWPL